MQRQLSLTSLKQAAEFSWVNQKGLKKVTKNFIIIGAKPSSDSVSQFPTLELRYGLKVSKKIFRQAVKRNKIKRQIRHMLRLFYVKACLPTHLWIIIIPRQSFAYKNFHQLFHQFEYTINSLIKELE